MVRAHRTKQDFHQSLTYAMTCIGYSTFCIKPDIELCAALEYGFYDVRNITSAILSRIRRESSLFDAFNRKCV